MAIHVSITNNENEDRVVSIGTEEYEEGILTGFGMCELLRGGQTTNFIVEKSTKVVIEELD